MIFVDLPASKLASVAIARLGRLELVQGLLRASTGSLLDPTIKAYLLNSPLTLKINIIKNSRRFQFYKVIPPVIPPYLDDSCWLDSFQPAHILDVANVLDHIF